MKDCDDDVVVMMMMNDDDFVVGNFFCGLMFVIGDIYDHYRWRCVDVLVMAVVRWEEGGKRVNGMSGLNNQKECLERIDWE